MTFDRRGREQAVSDDPAALQAAAHVFVADLALPLLEAHDAVHLARVLRLRSGEHVTVADGRGNWRLTVVPAGFPDAPLEPIAEVVHQAAPLPALTVACALTKGDKPELVVQKLTELGIDRIAFFAAEHSVVRWDDEKRRRNVVRLAVVAREAAMQCRRAHLPQIDIVTFTEAASSAGVALADRGGEPCSLRYPTVLVGPEGGWSSAERDVGLPVVGFGGHVLRAETAAIAAAVLLGSERHKLPVDLD